MLIKKYRQPLLFLLKFALIYVILNITYAFYLSVFVPEPDPITVVITKQSSYILNLLGLDTSTYTGFRTNNIFILNNENDIVLSVYEGCNSLNVIIIFLAFILAFKWIPSNRWFIPMGIILIYFFNIVRILLLYYVSESIPAYLYFTHKYLFTASIFIIVFALWFYWMRLYKAYNEV